MFFRAINPKIVGNQKVINLTSSTKTVAVEKEIPFFTVNPRKLPSVITIPPGINDRIPAIKLVK